MFSDRLVGGGCWRINAGVRAAEGGRKHPSRQEGVVVAVVVVVVGWQSLLPSAGLSTNPAGERMPVSRSSIHRPRGRRR